MLLNERNFVLADCIDTSISSKKKSLTHRIVVSLEPGVALAHRLKVCTSHRALCTISASPVHNDSPPSVCCALKCSAEISTGAEIPFRCRGGQYMVKFQRVIPGAGHTKNC